MDAVDDFSIPGSGSKKKKSVHFVHLVHLVHWLVRPVVNRTSHNFSTCKLAIILEIQV
jgi:hypothetical protein